MKKFITALLFILLTSFPVFAQKTITITEECVYLDELTAKHIPHKKVMCGLRPGDSKLFSRDTIQNFLDREGLKGRVLNDVMVEREGEKLSSEMFLSKLQSIYEEAHPGTKIVIEQARIPSSVYAENLSDFQIEADTSKFGGSYAQIKYGDRKYQAYYYVKAFKKGYVTTERVKAGESMAGKVKEDFVEITNLKSKLVLNPEKMVAMRAMPQGKVITADLMQEKPVLKKGEPVKIVYNNGKLKIEARGVVEENAMPGRPVAVRNVSSQKVISANYIGNGIVKADF